MCLHPVAISRVGPATAQHLGAHALACSSSQAHRHLLRVPQLASCKLRHHCLAWFRYTGLATCWASGSTAQAA